jgi:hypothetical protein
MRHGSPNIIDELKNPEISELQEVLAEKPTYFSETQKPNSKGSGIALLEKNGLSTN